MGCRGEAPAKKILRPTAGGPETSGEATSFRGVGKI